jgi:hypothetical protein
MLLNAIVEGALDGAPVGVRGLDQTPSRPTKVLYLTLQSVDGVLRPLAKARARHRPAFRESQLHSDAPSRASDHRITLDQALSGSDQSLAPRSVSGYSWHARA